jgi:WD40 repeat protein
VLRSLDKTVKMWEVETGDLMFSLDHMFSYVHSVVFNPSGSKIAVGSSDNTVYVLNSWDADEEVIHTLEGHEVLSFSFFLSLCMNDRCIIITCCYFCYQV